MKLTTKGRYAVTAMLDLALHGADGPVPLAAISERQEISLSYLEQLFSRLRKNGLVVSTRGPGGGYCVSRPLDQVVVAQIIGAVNESVDATQCAGKENCLSHGRCLTHDLWEDLSRQIEDFLSGVSLADMIARHRGRPVARLDGLPGLPAQTADLPLHHRPMADMKEIPLARRAV